MTNNEEKALEIGTTIWKEWNDSTLATGAEKGAKLMAEWKDQQFKEYLEKKKSDIEQGVLHSNPLIDGDRWYGRADIINEIINELFGGE